MNKITERIIQFNKSRLPKMVEIKYRFMEQNPFRFYRGICHIFYEDLAKEKQFLKAPAGWISGDLHLENFGSFTGDNNQVYFDLNDFDEAVLAPVTWELARILTSIYVGFKSLNIDEEKADKMAQLFLRSYMHTLLKGKADYVEASTARGLICKFLAKVARRKQKRILIKRTSLTKRRVQMLTDNPKHFKIKKAFKEELIDHINDWLKTDERSPYNYKVVDCVFRLAGTGSVGLERYAFLLKSSNDIGHKYILLDMKEAVPSSLNPYVTIAQPKWQSEAERVITIQQRMQNRCPALLSVCYFKKKSFIMQEMQPAKDNLNFGLLEQYRDMWSVIDSMGMLTASSVLRSSGRDGSATADELIAFANNQEMGDALIRYAKHYSIQVYEYYREFLHDRRYLRNSGVLIKKIPKGNPGPLKDDIKHIEEHVKTIL